MLVGDEDGGELRGIFADQSEPAEELAAGEAGVDEDAGPIGADDRAVALGAGGENGHTHLVNIRRIFA